MIDGMVRQFKLAEKDGIPVYLAEKYADKKVRLFCPKCCAFHGHGSGDMKAKKLYHRASHCANRDFHPKGYYWFILTDRQKPKFW